MRLDAKRLFPAAAGGVLALLLASGCGRRGVILDHDGGIDDYVAMVMVLGSGERDVRGVTIAFGDSYPDQAVEATERVLARYGLRVPVGECRPALRGKNEFPAEWRERAAAVAKLGAFAGTAGAREGLRGASDAAGLGRAAGAEAAARGPGDTAAMQRGTDSEAAAGRPDSAVEVLRRALESRRFGTTDVLATGPLTNIAALLRASPELVSRIGRLVIMGGAVRVGGNAPGGGEYNIYVDPEAADFVFSLAARGLRIDLIPLDATNHLPVTARFLGALLESSAPPARQVGQILNLARDEITKGDEERGKSEYYLWDGGAALALLRPELFLFATLRLRVTPEGRTVEAPDGHGPIQVALGLKKGAQPMDEVRAILSRERR